MSKATVPYVLVGGVKVADNWTDLIDGTLQAAIKVTELGGAPPTGDTNCFGGGFKPVWSNTNATGMQVNANASCANWTSLAGVSNWGLATATNSSWTTWCNGGACSNMSPLYCVQQ